MGSPPDWCFTDIGGIKVDSWSSDWVPEGAIAETVLILSGVPTQLHSRYREEVQFHCWRDWFELWVKKILSAKLPNRPKVCSHHPCHESLRFKQLWNYRAMATGNTAAVTLSEYHEFINHKVCHNVIVPDLGMCSCQQDCQDCTLTPHGNSFYLLYN